MVLAVKSFLPNFLIGFFSARTTTYPPYFTQHFVSKIADFWIGLGAPRYLALRVYKFLRGSKLTLAANILIGVP